MRRRPSATYASTFSMSITELRGDVTVVAKYPAPNPEVVATMKKIQYQVEASAFDDLVTATGTANAAEIAAVVRCLLPDARPSVSPDTRKGNVEASSRIDPREAALDVLAQYWADNDGQGQLPGRPGSHRPRARHRRRPRQPRGGRFRPARQGTARRECSHLPQSAGPRTTPALHMRTRDRSPHQARRQRRRANRLRGLSRHALQRGHRSRGGVGRNAFAAELLMPAVAVRTLWAQGKSVPKVARTFGVSEEAMQYRLAKLRLS